MNRMGVATVSAVCRRLAGVILGETRPAEYPDALGSSACNQVEAKRLAVVTPAMRVEAIDSSDQLRKRSVK